MIKHSLATFINLALSLLLLSTAGGCKKTIRKIDRSNANPNAADAAAVDDPSKINRRLLTTEITDLTPLAFGRHFRLRMTVEPNPYPDFYEFYICRKDGSLCNPQRAATREFFGRTHVYDSAPSGEIDVHIRACVRPRIALDPENPCGNWARGQVFMPLSQDEELARLLAERDALEKRNNLICRAYEQHLIALRDHQRAKLTPQQVAQIESLIEAGDLTCAMIKAGDLEQKVAERSGPDNTGLLIAGASLFAVGLGVTGYSAYRFVLQDQRVQEDKLKQAEADLQKDPLTRTPEDPDEALKKFNELRKQKGLSEVKPQANAPALSCSRNGVGSNGNNLTLTGGLKRCASADSSSKSIEMKTFEEFEQDLFNRSLVSGEVDYSQIKNNLISRNTAFERLKSELNSVKDQMVDDWELKLQRDLSGINESNFQGLVKGLFKDEKIPQKFIYKLKNGGHSPEADRETNVEKNRSRIIEQINRMYEADRKLLGDSYYQKMGIEEQVNLIEQLNANKEIYEQKIRSQTRRAQRNARDYSQGNDLGKQGKLEFVQNDKFKKALADSLLAADSSTLDSEQLEAFKKTRLEDFQKAASGRGITSLSEGEDVAKWVAKIPTSDLIGIASDLRDIDVKERWGAGNDHLKLREQLNEWMKYAVGEVEKGKIPSLETVAQIQHAAIGSVETSQYGVARSQIQDALTEQLKFYRNQIGELAKGLDLQDASGVKAAIELSDDALKQRSLLDVMKILNRGLLELNNQKVTDLEAKVGDLNAKLNIYIGKFGDNGGDTYILQIKREKEQAEADLKKAKQERNGFVDEIRKDAQARLDQINEQDFIVKKITAPGFSDTELGKQHKKATDKITSLQRDIDKVTLQEVQELQKEFRRLDLEVMNALSQDIRDRDAEISKLKNDLASRPAGVDASELARWNVLLVALNASQAEQIKKFEDLEKIMFDDFKKLNIDATEQLKVMNDAKRQMSIIGAGQSETAAYKLWFNRFEAAESIYNSLEAQRLGILNDHPRFKDLIQSEDDLMREKLALESELELDKAKQAAAEKLAAEQAKNQQALAAKNAEINDLKQQLAAAQNPPPDCQQCAADKQRLQQQLNDAIADKNRLQNQADQDRLDYRKQIAADTRPVVVEVPAAAPAQITNKIDINIPQQVAGGGPPPITEQQPARIPAAETKAPTAALGNASRLGAMLGMPAGMILMVAGGALLGQYANQEAHANTKSTQAKGIRLADASEIEDNSDEVTMGILQAIDAEAQKMLELRQEIRLKDLEIAIALAASEQSILLEEQQESEAPAQQPAPSP